MLAEVAMEARTSFHDDPPEAKNLSTRYQGVEYLPDFHGGGPFVHLGGILDHTADTRLLFSMASQTPAPSNSLHGAKGAKLSPRVSGSALQRCGAGSKTLGSHQEADCFGGNCEPALARIEPPAAYLTKTRVASSCA